MPSNFHSPSTKPKPEDFGFTAEEYERVSKGEFWNDPMQIAALFLAAIVIAVLLVRDDELRNWDFVGLGILIWVGLGAVAALISDFLPKQRKMKLYQKALMDFYLTQETFWLSLKGEKLEYMVADLFRKLGYNVEMTPRTNDKGIDLWLNKDNKNTIVQCKGHKNPIGPAVVRELLGTLISSSIAESAILVSPAGFTWGAKQAATGKAIQLISAHQLVMMVNTRE